MNLKNINLGHVILIGTLLVSIPRFAAAFSQAEPNFAGFNISPITGLGFGILVEVGIYYIISTWFSAKRRSLKLAWILIVGFVAQLIVAPIIIAPAIVAHINASGSEISSVLANSWALWGWSIITAVAPSLLLATVAAASYMQEPATKKPATSQQERGHASTRASNEPEQISKSEIVCQHCAKEFGSKQALNAHRRFCKQISGDAK